MFKYANRQIWMLNNRLDEVRTFPLRHKCNSTQASTYIKVWKYIEVHMKVLGWCLPQQQYIRFGRKPAWRHIVWQPGNPCLFYSHLYPSKKHFLQHNSVVSDIWLSKTLKYSFIVTKLLVTLLVFADSFWSEIPSSRPLIVFHFLLLPLEPQQPIP